MKFESHSLSVGERLNLDELLAALSDEVETLEGYIIPDVTRHDTRAEYTSDTLILEEVYRLSPGTYSLRFQYGWYAHHGCKDQQRGDIEFDEIRFSYRKGIVKFKIPIIEKRSTFEEF